MTKDLKWRLLVCIVVTVLTVWALAPTAWIVSHPTSKAPPSWMPKTGMKLGLDLQGGVHLVLGVDLDKVVNDQLLNYGNYIVREMEHEGLKGLKVKVVPERFELEMTTNGAAENEKVAQFVRNKYGLLEFVGETQNILVLRMVREQEDRVRTGALDQSIETIRNRIDEFGVAEPIITKKGENQIMVQFPGAQEPERLKALLGQTAKLNFQMVYGCTANQGDCILKQHADLEEKIKKAETEGKYTKDSFKRFWNTARASRKILQTKFPPTPKLALKNKKT